jgi:hypothetical protein
MRPAGTPMDGKTASKLVRYGILTDGSPRQMSKEQALVLIGEAMFEHFVEEFRSVWHELFSNQQTRENRVSTETIEACVREERKPRSEYQRADCPRDEYLHDRRGRQSRLYLPTGGDKYGVDRTRRSE